MDQQEGGILTRDILANMAAKLDEAALARLYTYPPYRESLRVILGTREFWYERAMYLMGKPLEWRPNANWKDIYYALKNTGRGGWSKGKYKLALADMDTLLTMEEVFGPLRASDYREGNYTTLLSDIDDVRVFDYITAKEPGRRYLLWSVLKEQIDRQNRAIIDKLLPLTKTYRSKPSEWFNAVKVSVTEGDLQTLRYLLEETKVELSEDKVEDLITEATERDQLPVYQYLDDRYPDSSDEDETLLLAAQNNSIRVFRYLYDKNPQTEEVKHALLEQSASVFSISPDVFIFLSSTLENVDWVKLLQRASRIGADNLAELIMPHIDPDADLSLLPWDTENPSEKLILLVLSGVNSDPSRHLDQILDMIRDDHSPALTYILLSDPRIRIEKLTRDQVIKIYNTTRLSQASSLHAIAASMHASQEIADNVIRFLGVGEPLLSNDSYSLTLREMLFKKPSKLALADWMTEIHDPGLITASLSVVDDRQTCPEELVPLQRLMFAMLYPDYTALQQLREVKSQGHTAETIEKTEVTLFIYDTLMWKEQQDRRQA